MEEIWNNPYARPLVATALILALFPLIVGYIVLAERKVLADIQTRLGPMRVGPYGFLQPIADAVKLMLKEDIIPANADKWLFWGAPVLSTFTALSALAVVPFSDKFYVADVNIGILFILAVASVGVLGLILGGWSSNSHYSLLGALRSAAQMVSYEVPMAFSVVAGLMAAGTLSMQGIVEAQREQGIWFAFSNYGLMLLPTAVYMIAGVAETNRAPFDLPEAESEIVAGFHTEYSGFRFSLYFLAEYAAIVVVAAIAVTLFWGGWLRPFPGAQWLHLPLDFVFPTALFAAIGLGCLHLTRGLMLAVQKAVMLALAGAMFLIALLFAVPVTNELLIGMFWFVLKISLILYVFIWFRGTFPRFRYDQLMDFGWRYLIPVSMGALIVNGAVLLLTQ